ncbi:hypothetical protein SO802_032309 [Lithocarpus litseifolius]|uniref:Uncharacterized protein n=1 Tax=Lithocarpus litseifolius TaxID=425828 RepID=A0AAW2BPC2_9ROSI
MRIRNTTNGIYRRFCRREKVAKDSSLFRKSLIVVSESSSRIIDEKPRSNAKRIALTATKASMSPTKGGSVTFSGNTARILPNLLPKFP